MKSANFQIILLVATTICLILILGAAVLYERHLLKISFNRRIEDFKKQLARETQRHMNQYKNFLSQQRVAAQVGTQSGGEVLLSLFNLLSAVNKAAINFEGIYDLSELTDRARTMSNQFAEFRRYYDEHAILMNEGFGAKVDHFWKQNESHIRLLQRTATTGGNKDKMKAEKLKGAWAKLEPPVVDMMRQLKREYSNAQHGSSGATTWTG